MTQVATTPATITVAICTRDRPDYLRECLAGLRCQTVPAPVLVVDSGSGDVAADRIRALVDVYAGAQLVRVDRAGLSVARNAALAAVGDGYVAFLDDDAVPAPDFVASVRSAVRAAPRPPALLGGRVLPQWEAPLPDWWPDRLRGVLSLIDADGVGEFGVVAGAAPCGANLIVDAHLARDAGGFPEGLGRDGRSLLSDEETLLAERLRRAGYLTWYDSRILVHHQIQAERLRPSWLLRRMYWQGVSRVLSRRALGEAGAVLAELPRRLVLAALLAPLTLWPATSGRLMTARWRGAYAAGFVRAALRPRATV